MNLSLIWRAGRFIERLLHLEKEGQISHVDAAGELHTEYTKWRAEV